MLLSLNNSLLFSHFDSLKYKLSTQNSIGFIMIFTVSPVKSLFFLIFLVVLQQLEGQFIYPRVVGSSIGLPGILVFAAVTVGASLFGIMGVLLGIPLMATVYQLLKDDLRKRERPAPDKEE